MPIKDLSRANTQINGFNQDKKQEFLSLLKTTNYNVVGVCEKMSMSFRTFYLHLHKDSKFAEQVSLIKRNIGHKIQNKSIQNALKDSSQFQTSQIFQLKHLLPEMYGDKQINIGVKGDVSISYGDSKTNPLRGDDDAR